MVERSRQGLEHRACFRSSRLVHRLVAASLEPRPLVDLGGREFLGGPGAAGPARAGAAAAALLRVQAARSRGAGRAAARACRARGRPCARCVRMAPQRSHEEGERGAYRHRPDAAHSDDEIEVILAHELAHHVHRDIWSAIALETVLIALGFFIADRVLAAFATSFDLTGKSDIAALPLLLLAMGGVSVLLMPLANAFSRAHERRADRYALTMTGNAAAFVAAMKRLAAQNLAEEHPSRIVEVLFHSHPSTNARIAAAQTWAAGQPDRSRERGRES